MTGIFTAFAIAAITLRRMRRLAHQAAAGVVLRDLRHRTAHVDVDDVGAHAFDDLRGRRHLVGIAAEDLDRDRPLFLGVLGVLERAIDAADQPFGAHHLGDDQPAAAVALDQPAERRVGHAGHRRDGERRREVDGADFQCTSSLRRYPHCADHTQRVAISRVHRVAVAAAARLHGRDFLLFVAVGADAALTEHVWDKMLHTIEYAGLAVLIFRAVSGEGVGKWTAAVATIVLVSAYGASDSGTRCSCRCVHPDVYDWLTDTLAGIVGAAVSLMFYRKDRRE